MSPFPLGGIGMVALVVRSGPVGMGVCWPVLRMSVELEKVILIESYLPEVMLAVRTWLGRSLLDCGMRSTLGPLLFWLAVTQPVVAGRPAVWSCTSVKLA